MLPKAYRITKSFEIKEVMREGKRFSSHFFSLKSKKSKNKFPRFAIVADLKVSKKATVRNRLRRQIHEIIRLNIGEIFGGHNTVLWIKPSAVGKDFQELRKDFFWLMRKANLMR